MPDVHLGGSIVVRDHGEAACHCFQGDIAKGFGFAGKEEHVCGSEMVSQLLTGAYATKDEMGIFSLQRAASRPVTYDDKLQ